MGVLIDTEFFQHSKTEDFCRRIAEPRGWHYIVSLWLRCSKTAPDGDLTSLQGEGVERLIDWKGEDGLFWESAVKAGFLDFYPDDTGINGRLLVHDWLDRQGVDVTRKALEFLRTKVSVALAAGDQSEAVRLEGEVARWRHRLNFLTKAPSTSPALSVVGPLKGKSSDPMVEPGFDQEASFQQAYASYPRQPGDPRDRALETFKGTIRTTAEFQDILRAIEGYKVVVARRSPEFQKMICHFAKFLTDPKKSWRNYIDDAPPPPEEVDYTDLPFSIDLSNRGPKKTG